VLPTQNSEEPLILPNGIVNANARTVVTSYLPPRLRPVTRRRRPRTPSSLRVSSIRGREEQQRGAAL
jgi:hypothetical protein